MTTTAYSYVRFSSRNQKDGDSLRRQVEESRAYAAAQKWHLDESLRPVEGVSAWSGKHRETGGTLATFLALCDEGRVQRGSWLIVEALDRLSREQISNALTLFLRIISSGCGIVTLADRKQYSESSINENPYELMYSIALMSSANEFSRKLSARLKAAKETAVRDLLAGRRATIHGKPPYWCDYDRETGTYRLHPQRSKIMREAVSLTMSGVGSTSICHRFAEKGYRPHVAANQTWTNTSLARMLRSRALMGEYTPTKMDAGKRRERCDPIPHYYPALLTSDEWYALQGQLATRKKSVKGRRGSGVMFNVLGNLMTCGHDGTTMKVTVRRNGKRKNPKGGTTWGPLYKSLVSKSFRYSFPYDPILSAFLEAVSEVKLREGAAVPDDVSVYKGQLAERRERIGKLKEAMSSGDVSKLGVVVEAVAALQSEIDELTKRIEDKTAARHKRLADPSDVADLALKLKSAKGEELVELQQRVRMAIADVVTSATFWVYGNTCKRVAVVVVTLRDGQQRVCAARTNRREEPLTMTDDVLYRGPLAAEVLEKLPDHLGKALLEAEEEWPDDTTEVALNLAWEDALADAYA
jgi:DNA invertase Pin-like site-specific DNA recombinase